MDSGFCGNDKPHGNGFLLVGLVLVSIIALSFQNEQRVSRVWRIEAKVDAILRHLNLTFDQYANAPPEVRDALGRGETIVAIKKLREATGMSLGEAKDFVAELKRRGETAADVR